MAKAAKRTNEEAGEDVIIGPVTETVTYMPGNGDPTSVTWCGHTFQANMPKEITGHADGSAGQQLNHHLIERARDNPHFKVGDARAKRAGRELPTTPEGYRAYIAAWLQDPSLQTTDQLIQRFARDRDLQAACEVGTSDWELISTLFVPKLHDMAKADELTEEQVAKLWVNAGINQLPW